MPLRQNLKPTLPDTLRKLRQDTVAGNTVAHGVKTVLPGEGLQLVSSEGSQILWDWETANLWNTRITEGREALEQARADLDAAEQSITAGTERINENRQILDALGPQVDQAQSTITQTAQDLATLQNTFGDVQDKALAAEQRATDALNKAGAALTSANGKNTITDSVNPPSGPGTAPGDIHRMFSSLGGGGTVIREQRWDGATWQDLTLSHTMFSSIDLGKATVGELDGARIRVGSISADRVMIGLGQNLVANSSGGRGVPEPHSAYYGGVKTGVPGSTGGTVFYTTLTMGGWGDALVVKSGATTANGRAGDFVLDPRSQYVLRLRMKKVSGTGQGRVKINVYDINGALLRNAFSPAMAMGTDWSNLEVRLSGADVAGGVSAGIVVQNPRDGEYWYEQLDFRELVTGELMVDGSITGRQIEAHSVAGEIGRFLQLEAANGVFTDSLTGRNATLLGQSMAEALNITGLLRGRDALFDGTVDIEQLNVTGEMAGTIARFMDVYARRAIFTEGLTAAESVLLGTTVAEAINADEVASRIMTGGLLQTTSANNRGVKLDNNGIRAWDNSGRQTVQINGTSNYITGSFSTAETGQRVRIRNASTVAGIDFFASNNTDDHLGIWYDSPDNNVLNAVAKIQAMTSVQNTSTNPALFMWPMRGTFGFQGRWGQDTDATKFVVLTNFAGLGPGAYNTITINYQSKFPTNNSLRCPFVSVESASGADVMATVVQQTESSIRLNIINQSGGKSSGTIVLRIVTFNINA